MFGHSNISAIKTSKTEQKWNHKYDNTKAVFNWLIELRSVTATSHLALSSVPFTLSPVMQIQVHHLINQIGALSSHQLSSWIVIGGPPHLLHLPLIFQFSQSADYSPVCHETVHFVQKTCEQATSRDTGLGLFYLYFSAFWSTFLFIVILALWVFLSREQGASTQKQKIFW